MQQELDINAIVAQFLALKLDSLVASWTSQVKAKRAQERARLREAYKDYLTHTLRRHAYTKSFFVREKAVELYSFYIPLSIKVGELKLENPGASDLVGAARHAVVIGTAGSGKTMFMRHLCADAVMNHVAVPVFIQLRDLDQAKNSLMQGIMRGLEAHGAPCEEKQVRATLRDGLFLLLLDGFDEVATSNRGNLTTQVATFSDQYPQTAVVVSSRPDSQFGGWSEFSVAELLSLSLDEACALVNTLPIDNDLRDRFVADLRGGLYAKHKDFLSNPLLLSMMVLTYGEYAQIPSKLATFFGQAYETLFQRHDALKRGFKRERQTNLDIHDFSRVFSAFSLLTYDERQTSFPRVHALEVIKEAANVVQVDVEPDRYLGDCQKAVCLLLEDGLEMAFAHRSFQEYFTALFIASAPPETQKALLEKYRRSVNRDAVFPLLYELRPEAVEQFYVLPGLAALRRRTGVSSSIGVTHYAKYVSAVVEEMHLGEDGRVVAWAPNEDGFNLACFVHDYVRPRLGLARMPFLEGNPELAEEVLAINKEGGDDSPLSVHVGRLTYRSPIMHALFEHARGFIGASFLQGLLETEDVLRRRLTQAEASLNRILTSGRSSERGAGAGR